MLGDLGLAQPEPVNEVADRGLPGTKGIEEFPSASLSDGVERIGRRRSSSHEEIIC
jgi:hypothetical protein